MGRKTIAISDAAHRRLKTLKKPGETYSMLIERITPQKGILELAGALTPQEGRTMNRVVRSMRMGSSDKISRLRLKKRDPRQH